ncbi:hypothetical protein PGT21_010465 [Puccinia graminis f. sp. tritici]|uniref:DUF6589 domain-containing protein n=1 Tax=Puccinia graminis f. sp. tritici TaxID=56615 RepID=A0A5B0M418_PUCGR|nr:hypothetical protein PGT21_010465 [Puccinia graminis f. sp. tritici]
MRKQKPRKGYFPEGSYYSSKRINQDFFSEDARAERSGILTQVAMPFLYNLLLGKLARPIKEKIPDNEDSSDNGSVDLSAFDDTPLDDVPDTLPEDNPLKEKNPKIPLDLNEDDVMAVDADILRPSPDPAIRKETQNQDMARTICSMVVFGCNRRNNGMQLTNGLLFIACGVTERVNKYLNYVGLSCSRKTAHIGLATLGKEFEKKLRDLFGNNDSKVFSPSICIDNLDFQQSIHTKSVGRSSTMFHGTWGYIHRLPREFFDGLDHSQLTLSALKHALKEGISLEVHPRHFGPTSASEDHFKSTLKSQLTRVLLSYIASSNDKKHPLPTHPPPVKPIKTKKADLTMLKLMMASDNSSEGIGDVLSGLIQQSGMNAKDFSTRLQVLEGDLGTCMNILILRELQIPAGYSTTSLAHILSIPGGAHTMWNFAQSIFLHHWGDQTNQKDTGAWQILKALGIPADKPVTKRDFTLMITNMEKIHEADLLYCILVVMGKEDETLPEELPAMSPSSIEDIVERTYERF